MNPESRLVQNIRKKLAEWLPGAFVVKLADRATRGLPDLLVLAVNDSGELCAMAFEVKTETGRLSAIQQEMLSRIARAGRNAKHGGGRCGFWVVRSVHEAKAALKLSGFKLP